MKALLKFGIIISLISISGCETTGGTIGGLFPAPKFLEGKIENNIYTAKDSLFSISIPHPEGSYEYKYMQVKEQFKNNEAYVSFGPAAFNKSIYRVHVIIHPDSGKKTVPLDKAAPQIIKSYEQQMHKHYGTNPKIQETKIIKINNNKTYYWKLSQDIPAGKHISNSNAIFNHHIYVIDYKIAAGIIWVRIPADTGPRGGALIPNKFAESLKLNTK